MTRHVRALGFLLVALGLCARVQAAKLPVGFTEAAVVRGINGATAMDFAPDGRLFVCEQTGALRIVKNDVLMPLPFVTVAVDSSWERGLLGVAFDPNFDKNHHVYLNYVADEPYPHHRISRFTADGDTAKPGSEVILLEGDNQEKLGGGVKNGHQGGAIHFGADGKLYVALGDQTAEKPAQDLHTLQGKMLRINADGSIPKDNPFYAQTTGKYRTIWAIGLRNPFTFAFQPGTSRMFINDVGGSNEEINVGEAGANYGWPLADHGPTRDARFRGPIHWYKESSIAGGAFYNPPRRQFPERYVGKYFFADFKQGWIRTLDPDKPSDVRDFLTGLGNLSAVDLKIASDGSLYYLRRLAWVRDKDYQSNTGVLYKIRYVGADAPACIESEPVDQRVTVGQSASFQVVAGGGAPLRFQWQRDESDVGGATHPDFVLSRVTSADNRARFRCIVRNAYGEAVGRSATLTVLPSFEDLAAMHRADETENANAAKTPYGLAKCETLADLNVPWTRDKAPALLSQTRLFASLLDLRPRSGLIPYAVNVPLWSDGATKQRWMVPGRSPIDFTPQGEWTFPAGTVFVKHFELPLDERDLHRKRRLETRLLVVDGTGNGYGATYKWRSDNREADLLHDSLREDVTIQTVVGVRKQTWYYPSPADCLTCHTAAAKFVLGVKTRQLNGRFTYPRTGVTDNQLRTWNRLGLFAPRLDEKQIDGYAKLVSLDDAAASRTDRVRSYLDANCANCHRPGNVIRATFDARFETPLARQGLLDAPTVSDSLNLTDPRVVAAGDLGRSMLIQRMRQRDKSQMPPLASTLPDRAALAVCEQWIEKEAAHVSERRRR